MTRGEWISRSPAETEHLGERLARGLPDGTVVALHGDLATGKTCLVRGMARVYGPSDLVHSPTFTLVNRYGTAPYLHHLDLYRLSGAEEALDLGIEELMAPEGICVVEWAERAAGILPADCLRLYLEHHGHDQRRITWDAPNQELGALLSALTGTPS